jgi:hypothetical protein
MQLEITRIGDILLWHEVDTTINIYIPISNINGFEIDRTYLQLFRTGGQGLSINIFNPDEIQPTIDKIINAINYN